MLTVIVNVIFVCLFARRRGFLDNATSFCVVWSKKTFFVSFRVFWSSFRTLAVSLVSDFFMAFAYLLVCTKLMMNATSSYSSAFFPLKRIGILFDFSLNLFFMLLQFVCLFFFCLFFSFFQYTLFIYNLPKSVLYQ